MALLITADKALLTNCHLPVQQVYATIHSLAYDKTGQKCTYTVRLYASAEARAAGASPLLLQGIGTEFYYLCSFAEYNANEPVSKLYEHLMSVLAKALPDATIIEA